jgi:transposase
MSGPISNDLRIRAVAAVDAGASRRQAARRFGVGVSSVIRWVEQHRRTGSVAPMPMGGRRRPLVAGEHRQWLLERIAAQPDLTLEEMRRELAERGLQVGYGTVWRFCARERLSFKKKPARHPAGST